ncbi:MAG: cobalamin-binding protein [Chloroflexi bacterium]|nr:cobalamin-binding protein [Chloroflexota bacterium]
MKHNTKLCWSLLTLLFILLLSACSTTDTADPNPTLAPTEVAVEIEPTAEPTPEPVDTTITLTDGLGNEITLDSPVQKIISLAPSNTEILFAIGAGEQVVGRDSVSDYPEAALQIADIGGGFGELDMETIIAMEPDLVLTADITPPEQVEALTDVGLTVFAIANPVELAGMYENLRLVAQLTGHEAETETMIADLKTRVAAVSDQIATVEEKPLVFYELDGTDPNAPWTSGPGTFVDTLISMAGGQNLGASLDGAWVQVSVEELITQDPDIILLGDFLWGGVTPEVVAARENWDTLSAVQSNQVYTFDDSLASRPGPRLVDGLEVMAHQFYPDLFD